METLPLEIILVIFRLANKANLKSLRLVSRAFNPIAASILFMSVNASPHDEDPEVLGFIADDPYWVNLFKKLFILRFIFTVDGGSLKKRAMV
jgi:hypothetical protein